VTMLTTPTRTPWPMAPAPVRRFTVDEYHQLIQIGMMSGDEQVELLEGWITQKTAHNPPHDATVGKISRRLAGILPNDWIVRVQSAITTADSEPEPDHVVAPGPDDRYADHHPGPGEIALVIEVADSTLARDRGQRLRLYARAGIECYWIVNLIDRQIETYTDPTGPGATPQYRNHKDHGPGDAVPVSVNGRSLGTIPVVDLLPPP
jgi:Uma2 family endonuclease